MNEVARDLLDELIAKWSDGMIPIYELFQKIAEYKLSLGQLELGILTKMAEALISQYKQRPASSRDLSKVLNPDDRETGFYRSFADQQNIDANILRGCEEIAWRLQNDFQQYNEAIELYLIINSSGKRPHLCRRLSECYIQVHKYVEATQILQEASMLERNPQASMSGRQFYQIIERLYRDLDIKLW